MGKNTAFLHTILCIPVCNRLFRAIAISTKILAGDEQVIAGYRKFLSGGSSMHPIELLKLCGIDMTRPDAVQEALDVFGELLKQW